MANNVYGELSTMLSNGYKYSLQRRSSFIVVYNQDDNLELDAAYSTIHEIENMHVVH